MKHWFRTMIRFSFEETVLQFFTIFNNFWLNIFKLFSKYVHWSEKAFEKSTAVAKLKKRDGLFWGARKHCNHIKVIEIIDQYQMNQIIFSFWNIFKMIKLLPNNKYSKIIRRTNSKKLQRQFHQNNEEQWTKIFTKWIE